MKKNYELEWLDHMITTELNPETTDLKSVTNEQASEFISKIEREEVMMLTRLKSRVFHLHNEQDSRNLVKKYHDALVLMITKNHDYLLHPTAKENRIENLHLFIRKRLHRILTMFEKEFHTFLNENNLVPLTKLIELRQEIFQKEIELREKLAAGANGTEPVQVVMEVFFEFSDKIDSRIPISIREANYIRGLFEDVIDLNGNYTSITGCPALNELLIVWNVNSKSCIRYFTQGTEYLMNTFESPEEKLGFLELELKKLQNIPEKPDFTFNPDFESVKAYCTKWLKNEIAYRGTKLEGFIPIAQLEAEKTMKANSSRVVVAASVDQVGLLVRAADDLRILRGKSKSAIFKAIFPHISTPGSEHPNWNRSRTASYIPEESDKTAVKQLLQSMINKIDEY